MRGPRRARPEESVEKEEESHRAKREKESVGSLSASAARTRHPPRSRWPIWSHTVTFFVLPRSRIRSSHAAQGHETVPRDKVSKLGTYRRDRAVDFRAVGSFEETIWTTGEAIAAWSLARSGREGSPDGHGMPMERRREGSISCGSTDRSSNDVLDHLKMKDAESQIAVSRESWNISLTR